VFDFTAHRKLRKQIGDLLEKKFKTFSDVQSLMTTIDGDPLRGFGGSSFRRLIVSVEAEF
jgi:hypothetical protein